MKTTWLFVWEDKDGTVAQCELRDCTWEDARATATKFGWRPKKWYNPYTWQNYVIQG